MPPEPPIGVVADGAPLLRAGIMANLVADGVAVGAETGLGAEVVPLVTEHRAGLVIIGTLPDVPALEVARRLHARTAPPAIVLLLSQATPDAIAELLSLDVMGMVPRSIDAAGFVHAVRRVRDGERVVDPGILVTTASAMDDPDETHATSSSGTAPASAS